MTPDTAALRALAERHAEDRYPEVAVNVTTLLALCDAADEVERLRANGNGYLQRAHAAEAVIERMRCAHCGEVGCDWIGDIRKARAEMAEAQVVAVLALCDDPDPDTDDGMTYVSVAAIRAAMDGAS